MPDDEDQNYFITTGYLPQFYWNGEAKMHCIRQCTIETCQNAYNYHIQRLIVLGNFALFAGINIKQVNE